MASSIALRKASTSNILNKFINPMRSIAVAPSMNRSFNTNTQMRQFEGEDRDIDVDRRSDQYLQRRRDAPPTLFSEVFDPFSPTRSLSQVLNLMDQFMENPFLSASRGIGAGTSRGWDVKEDENGLYFRIEMPGLSKEDVKISVEDNTLIIKGEGEKESEDEESRRRYSSRIDIPSKLYKIDEIKAEMKNGVLRVFVPKVKEEERKDVFQVKVE